MTAAAPADRLSARLTPSEQQPLRILELDALRGFAALAVVLFHFTTRYDELFGHAIESGIAAPWGHYGVDLFFILSGFVIFMTLDRSRGVMDFLVGRVARLFPAYWAALGITFSVVAVAGLPGQEVTAFEAMLNTTMVQALLGARHVDGVYWSLQVELFFYFGMLVIHRARGFKHVHLVLAIWLAISWCVQCAIACVDGQTPLVMSALTKTQTLLSLKYIHLFAIGILLHRAGDMRRWPWQSWLLIASCIGFRSCFGSLNEALVVLSFGLLVSCATTGRLTFLSARPLTYLGSLSYSLYLIHQNVGYVVIRHLAGLGAQPVLAIAAALLLAVLLAIGLRAFVETPGQRFLKHQYRTLSLKWQSSTGGSAGATFLRLLGTRPGEDFRAPSPP